MVTLWMVFEAVAPDKKSVTESLEEHVEAMKSEERIEILEMEKDEVTEVDDPHPGLDKGYNQIVEMRAEMDDFTKAIETVINYGPTYVQFEGPDHYEMDLKESQETLQKVANTMHQYAQMGTGGVLISKPTEEQND